LIFSSGGFGGGVASSPLGQLVADVSVAVLQQVDLAALPPDVRAVLLVALLQRTAQLLCLLQVLSQHPHLALAPRHGHAQALHGGGPLLAFVCVCVSVCVCVCVCVCVSNGLNSVVVDRCIYFMAQRWRSEVHMSTQVEIQIDGKWYFSKWYLHFCK